MLRRSDIAPGSIATLAVIVALVAVVIPTCVMVGCTMSGGRMFVPFGSETTISAPCGGSYIFNSSPLGTIPSGIDALILSFVAALAATLVLFAPQPMVQPVRLARDGPPPPPEDPGDVRLLI